MAAYFRDARLKIERANKHLSDVEAAILSLEKGSTATVQNDPGAEFQELQHTIPDLERKLLDISLIVGDLLHNCRSALDFAWVGLMERCEIQRTSHTKFPIVDTKPRLEGILKDVEVRFPDLFREIVSDIQPYKGGNGLLWILNDLDISDKHLLLLSATPVAMIRNIVLEDKSGQLHHGNGFQIRTTGPYTMRFIKDVEIKDKGKLSFGVTIKEAGMLENLELKRFLPFFPETTLQIVEALERLSP